LHRCRYAETARNYFLRTGKRVKAWCFVQGARANRIFYAFEVGRAVIIHWAGLFYTVCSAAIGVRYSFLSGW
jgi:hypothetical protein